MRGFESSPVGPYVGGYVLNTSSIACAVFSYFVAVIVAAAAAVVVGYLVTCSL